MLVSKTLIVVVHVAEMMIQEEGKPVAGHIRALRAISRLASFYGSKYSLVLLLAMFYFLSSGVLSVTCWICLMVTSTYCYVVDLYRGHSSDTKVFRARAATADAFQWLAVDLTLYREDASHQSSHQPTIAPWHLLCEVLFNGVPVLGLAAVSSYVVIHHFLQWGENTIMIRTAEKTFHSLLKSPSLENGKIVPVPALEEQVEHLWKASFIFLAALCSRIIRLRRKGALLSWKEVSADGTVRLLSTAFVFLVSSWVFQRVG
jgi:hypothetical protein